MRRLLLSVDALVRVADYYRTGIGPQRKRRDLRRAFRLYSMAAAHNHPGAFYGMALVALSSGGNGIARRRWAVAWLKRAAMTGHAGAALMLSRLAARGIPGVLRPDPVAAEAWRLIALRLRGPAILSGKKAARTAAQLSPEQATRARRLADQFLASMMQLRRIRVGKGAAGATPSATAMPANDRAPE